MREHWQPTIFDRLEDGSKARALMVAQARDVWPTAEPPLLSLPPSWGDLLTRLPRPVRLVSTALSVATSLALAACGTTPKPSPEVQQPGSSPAVATKAGVTPERILPLSGEVYFTQGVHSSDGSPTGVKSGIDLAPKRVVNCTLGSRDVVEEQIARATASGTITIVGNEKDPNDPNHSIVEIQEDGTGLRFGVMHLSKLLDHIQVGGRVSTGFLIGKSSCEVPKGGKTTGVHLHQYVKDKNGKYLPINGFTFSGWTVQGDTMTRGNEKRVADQRRCNTDQACGGIRNDLNTGAVLGAAVGMSEKPIIMPTPPVVKAPELTKPAQESKEQPLPADLDTLSSLRFPYQFKAPRGWIEGPYHQGGSTDVYFGVQQKPATTLMITFAPARSDVKLEALKNQIIGPGDSRTEALPGNRGVMEIKFQEKYIGGLDAWEKITFDLKMVTRDIVFVRPGETWIIQFMLQGDWTQLMPNDRIQFLGVEKIKTVVRTFTLSKSK